MSKLTVTLPDDLHAQIRQELEAQGITTGQFIEMVVTKYFTKSKEGDSIDISYCSTNTRRGRVGHKIAHTLTTESTQGTPCFIDMNREPETTGISRCLTAKKNGGIRNHKREASGVLYNGRIRRLTPRECLRLQGWTDDRIDKVLAIQSDNQVYKQAGNGVTVNVVEAIGRRLAALAVELYGGEVPGS